jgi:hypothetical protein
MLLTYKIDLMQRLQQACALFLHDSIANHQIPMPHSCLPPFTAPSKLPQKNKNDYNELFISILAHFFPISLNMNC